MCAAARRFCACMRREKPLADDVDLANIAKRTPYFAGADLENIMNEAAILCAREGKDKITMRHLNDAIERVQMGPEKKSHIVSDEDKRLVACHEAGRAIVGELLDGCDDVHLVTIMPRGGSGGHTLLLPDKESDFTTRAQLLDFVAMALGGYAAETLVMGQMSTGASSDLQRATDICRRMVTQYGMSDDMGPIYLGGDHDEVFLARDYGQQSRTYSEDVAARIDAEVQRKMNDALARAMAILTEHRAQLDGLSDLLVEKETIDRAEFVAFLKGEPCPKSGKKTCSKSRNRFNRQADAAPEKARRLLFPIARDLLRDTERQNLRRKRHESGFASSFHRVRRHAGTGRAGCVGGRDGFYPSGADGS